MASRTELVTAVLADLAAESAWLDDLVAPLTPAGWARPTPAGGWTIAHQIAHLAWTDEQALHAASGDPAFAALIEAMLAGRVTVDGEAGRGAADPPADLLARWRTARQRLAAALAALDPGARVPWFGPPMSVASLATARLMETWAHGQDVADALGAEHPATAGLRHIADLVVRTRDFAFGVRGLTPPAEPFRVELAAPDGAVWAWGPPDAVQRVEGSALDLCLLATQRLHRADTHLRAGGADADRWLDIAQAFAGPPGSGRPPRDPSAAQPGRDELGRDELGRDELGGVPS